MVQICMNVMITWKTAADHKICVCPLKYDIVYIFKVESPNVKLFLTRQDNKS